MKYEEEVVQHPSFGQIRFARVSGRARFYGSELEQDHYISMTVQQSEAKRTLTKDWYHSRGLPLIEIRMTAGQFSEMITSMNHEGVCCTIECVNGVRVEPLPDVESRKELVHRQFEDRMKDFAKTLREKQLRAKELICKKTLSKADSKELEWLIDWITQEVSSNIPFFGQCFQETVDTVVSEAKMEVENAIQHKVNTLGLNALYEQNKLLSNENRAD